MADHPNQKPLWDAYGQAMGAATGLELLMRIALVAAAAKHSSMPAENRQKTIEQIQHRTFGPTTVAFMKEYKEFGANAEFIESVENAVSSRNYLAHHFLEGSLDGLRSDDGLELLIFECAERTEHFKSMENFIRNHCPADFDLFFNNGEGRAKAYVEGHPSRQRLADIKAGKIPMPGF